MIIGICHVEPAIASAEPTRLVKLSLIERTVPIPGCPRACQRMHLAAGGIELFNFMVVRICDKNAPTRGGNTLGMLQFHAPPRTVAIAKGKQTATSGSGGQTVRVQAQHP